MCAAHTRCRPMTRSWLYFWKENKPSLHKNKTLGKLSWGSHHKKNGEIWGKFPNNGGGGRGQNINNKVPISIWEFFRNVWINSSPQTPSKIPKINLLFLMKSILFWCKYANLDVCPRGQPPSKCSQGVATIVQGTIVQGNSYPRDFCPMMAPLRDICSCNICPGENYPLFFLLKHFFPELTFLDQYFWTQNFFRP